MKTFADLRESLGRKPTGKVVFDKKLSGIPVKIHDEGKRFVVYIDGDRLDDYKTAKEAENMASQFVKQYKD